MSMPKKIFRPQNLGIKSLTTGVSEENRRYLRGINFNDRYTLYNAPIELILGEPKLLVVCFKKEKNVSQICNISM